MKTNVGGFDRAVRIIAGIIILSLVFVLEGNARWWGLIGLIPLLTGLVRWCPAYTLFGVSTCPSEEKQT
jgi:sulfite exporter TauE/SafE